MPKVSLPSTPKGWLVALAGSFVGFFAGFVAMSILTRWLK